MSLLSSLPLSPEPFLVRNPSGLYESLLWHSSRQAYPSYLQYLTGELISSPAQPTCSDGPITSRMSLTWSQESHIMAEKSIFGEVSSKYNVWQYYLYKQNCGQLEPRFFSLPSFPLSVPLSLPWAMGVFKWGFCDFLLSCWLLPFMGDSSLIKVANPFYFRSGDFLGLGDILVGSHLFMEVHHWCPVVML